MPALESRRRWPFRGVVARGPLADSFIRGRFLLAATLVLAGSTPMPACARATAAEPAPDFALADLDGKVHRLSAERGKIVLLDFWASWCVPCGEELGCLAELRRRHGEELRIVSVTIDRDADTARGFLAKRALFPDKVLHDGDSDVFSDYGADGLPALYLIDREGVVREVHDGAGGCRAVEPRLAEMLGAGAVVDGSRDEP